MRDNQPVHVHSDCQTPRCESAPRNVRLPVGYSIFPQRQPPRPLSELCCIEGASILHSEAMFVFALRDRQVEALTKCSGYRESGESRKSIGLPEDSEAREQMRMDGNSHFKIKMKGNGPS